MTSIFVKVYIGEDDTTPGLFGIYGFTGNIDQLKEKIKEKKQPRLDHVAADELVLYHPGTAVSEFHDESKKYRRLSADPPSDTTEDSPVVVLAPSLSGVPQQQPQKLEGDIAEEMQAMRLEIHAVRETLPSVLVGHVITPSQASRIPQVVSSIFDSLGLSLSPRAIGERYELPTSCGDEWRFSWKWKSGTNMDDRVLERTSYKPIERFLRDVGLFCVDISEGQYCVEKLLYNVDVFTRRTQNPLEVRGQQVFLRHRVQGRSDLAVLRADNESGYILRHNVKFVVEIKTVTGYKQSQTGCMREAQLQLIGLNAFNTNNSPPVVLSNLARVHQVLYLDTDEDWNYSIRVRHCSSFAAAIHFANTQSERACISYHFSRPNSPDPEY